ncbi:GGDEF domain-containing protein [Mesorhizobium sp. M7A.F.Ca.CA.001.09.2.1]|uniref:diguanylate cyclase n=1 Tax=Mesorhizobium ciceri TaxID=39645 RepID=A0AB38T7Y4_9HYPH|nr:MULTISPECIES: GGDEF domain-containing protein [Mesorhizobium]RUY55747.1 GGDEF domain-containing protein [Mesorhizobium sp. M7A.F.Ca.CA.001.13.2.1]MDF3217976.1 GGDEF domain-containing protein [Mesorhizobium ciceri]RUY66865.1 GGDEF domain-containing protein [Mesorhizobium sp. M7A.F.Ca.CA.001.13.1.1]RUY72946.1 GGDEF domain-containing protein [Mesorhizobium sp. M7A.F.Ca.CA.001.05.1.1]RUY80249.1 GGDEF domain-containing protein [Mesorhizobium sp. M7A.F.Ca.CA.001.09.2.1]
MKLDLSPTSWGRVIAVTAVGTAFFIAVAFFVDSFNFPYLSPEAVWRAQMTDLMLPLVLGGSFLFFLTWKIRQLAIAQRDLSVIAATDSLTAVLNRGAFSMLVEAYLEQTRKQEQTRSGALLIIDADHFKSINDRLGHDCGDQALKLIAQAIKGQLRGGDIVGRIGGEEFGVFLPGVDPSQSWVVAESIRRRIREMEFSPGGRPCPLSVSIGGTSFTGPITYEEIFSAADKRLYTAKSNGRDQVSFDPAGATPVSPPSVATVH